MDFARKVDAQIIVRGLRAVTDFEYELQMSQTNTVLNENVDTIFFTTSLEYAYLSSSTVRERRILELILANLYQNLLYNRFTINLRKGE